jgi:hypothetical protein
LGDIGPLREAMARRGVDSSILDQQTPASAGFNPATTPPSPTQAVPAPAGALQPATIGGISTTPPISEAELIIKALSERLKALSAIEKGGLSAGNPLV